MSATYLCVRKGRDSSSAVLGYLTTGDPRHVPPNHEHLRPPICLNRARNESLVSVADDESMDVTQFSFISCHDEERARTCERGSGAWRTSEERCKIVE